jgi:hypothetical protein
VYGRIDLSRPYENTPRAMLLKMKARTEAELNTMSDVDKRNTLIVELSYLSSETNWHLYNDEQLAAMAGINVL